MVSSASVFSTAKWLEAQSLLFKAVAVLFGSLILTAGSYITVPMVPVPITMQTFAITVVGAVYGWRLGGLTVLFWLMQGALGLPVFAPGAVGGYGMHVSPYEKGNIFNRDPLRVKKLLLHKGEINKLVGKIAEKGFTLVPLKVYFKGSLVKVEIGLAKGKKLYDKRADIAKKDMRREAEKEFKVRNL